jgi:hypothetical protein
LALQSDVRFTPLPQSQTQGSPSQLELSNPYTNIALASRQNVLMPQRADATSPAAPPRLDQPPTQFQPSPTQPMQWQPMQGQPLQFQPMDRSQIQNPYQPNPYQSNPYQPNPYQPNPYERNPYPINPYERNPYQPNPNQPMPEAGMARTINFGNGSLTIDANGDAERLVNGNFQFQFAWQHYSDGSKEMTAMRLTRRDGRVFDFERRQDGWYMNGTRSPYQLNFDSESNTFTWRDSRNGRGGALSADGTRQSINGNNRIVFNESEQWAARYQNGSANADAIKYPDGTRRFFSARPDGTLNSVRLNVPGSQQDETWTRVSDNLYRSGNKLWHARMEVRGTTLTITDLDSAGHTVTHYRADGSQTQVEPNEQRAVTARNGHINRVETGNNIIEVARDPRQNANITGVNLTSPEGSTTYLPNQDGSWSRYSGSQVVNDGFQRLSRPTVDRYGTVSFLTPEGLVIQRPGEEPRLNNPDAAMTRRILSSNLDDAAKMRFLQNLASFENSSDFTSEQKQRCVAQMTRLMDGRPAPDSQGQQRFQSGETVQLAEQMAWHLAQLASDAQGGRGLCNTTDIRLCLNMQDPDIWCRMVTDVILTNNFRTADGTTITIPPGNLRPCREARSFPPEDGKRSWLGQISDIACGNIFWQRQTHYEQMVNGQNWRYTVARGSLRYEEVRPENQNDGGLRVFLNGRRDPILRDEIGLAPEDIMDVYRQITGRPEANRYILNTQRRINDNSIAVISTADQLRAALARGGPQIIQVYDNVLYGLPRENNESTHVVVITNYDRNTDTVNIKNSHRDRYNRLGPNRISVQQLFEASRGAG